MQARNSTPTGKQGTPIPEATLNALPKPQRARLSLLSQTCKRLKLGKRLRDGAIIITGIPGWEQGRMQAGKWTTGYGRTCTWALAPDGTLYGHGWGKNIPAAYAKAGASLLPSPTEAGISLAAKAKQAKAKQASKAKQTPATPSKAKQTPAKQTPARQAQAATAA